MGLSGISKSQVSKVCKEIDERVGAFLERPLEGEWPYLWLDATYLKVRDGDRLEPRGDSRRLQLLEGWSHGNEEAIEAVPGGAARARRPARARAGSGARLAGGGDPLERQEGRVQRRCACGSARPSATAGSAPV